MGETGKQCGAIDANAIARAHAVYTPLALTFYDQIVHGLSNRFAWRCPTPRLVELYKTNLSENHLEAGVGTGFFVDRAARRLARFRPSVHQANLLAPLELALEPFDSVALTYVLHCLPGAIREKLVVVDHLKPFMAEGAVLFGATILGRGIHANLPARTLLDLYNAKGVFNNRVDDLEALSQGLEQRFSNVTIEQKGCVAVFRAV